jgi:hypothetical protein
VGGKSRKSYFFSLLNSSLAFFIFYRERKIFEKSERERILGNERERILGDERERTNV